MRVIWNDDKRALRTHECLTALSIYRAYKQAGDDYLTEVDVAKTGYVVRKDIRNTTPASVFEVFTELYQSLVGDIDNLYNDRDGMREKMQSGSWDPIEALLEDERMKNAIGVFLQRKHIIVNRMSEGKAYDRARDERHEGIHRSIPLRRFANVAYGNSAKRIQGRKGHWRFAPEGPRS